MYPDCGAVLLDSDNNDKIKTVHDVGCSVSPTTTFFVGELKRKQETTQRAKNKCIKNSTKSHVKIAKYHYLLCTQSEFRIYMFYIYGSANY